jgi:hypothetical protein
MTIEQCLKSAEVLNIIVKYNKALYHINNSIDYERSCRIRYGNNTEEYVDMIIPYSIVKSLITEKIDELKNELKELGIEYDN